MFSKHGCMMKIKCLTRELDGFRELEDQVSSLFTGKVMYSVQVNRPWC